MQSSLLIGNIYSVTDTWQEMIDIGCQVLQLYVLFNEQVLWCLVYDVICYLRIYSSECFTGSMIYKLICIHF